MTDRLTILQGDCLDVLRTLPEASVHCCVTSPPYWGLRDYGVAGQIGLEPTPQEYVAKMVDVFREVRRVLRGDGTCWVNLGDSYTGGIGWKHGDNSYSTLGPNRDGLTPCNSAFQAVRAKQTKIPIGLKPKDLVGIPWRVAFALQSDGWYLRSDIIWHKPNPMPESVTDRPTKAHEYIFLLSKGERYAYDAEAVKEASVDPESLRGFSRTVATDRADEHITDTNDFRTRIGIKALKTSGKIFDTRNKRTVWTVATAPYSEAHFATFPPDLIKPCILAGCPVGGTVLDPFAGSGTTLMVALELGRKAIGIELNPEYIKMQLRRTAVTPGLPLF